MDTEKLLADRGNEYGEAWYLTARILMWFRSRGHMRMMDTSPLQFAWVIILCKLIRLLRTPDHADSWNDIAGYATLASNRLAARSSDVHGE